MKRLLLISEIFPPQFTVGALRAAYFARYLPENNWTTSIVTRYFTDESKIADGLIMDDVTSQNQIIRISYGAKDEQEYLKNNSFLRDRFKRFFLPEYSRPLGVIEKMFSAVDEVIMKNKFDAVLGTTSNLYTLAVAKYAACKQKIPWIADIRDLVEQFGYKKFPLREKLWIYRTAKRRTIILKSASAIISVSGTQANILRKQTGLSVHVIMNGFDPDLFQNFSDISLSTFRIVYTGRLLDKTIRDPELLFGAIDKLLMNGEILAEDINIDFYGSEMEIVDGIAKNYRCRFLVTNHDAVSYDKVPYLLKQSAILLVLTARGKKGILTTKLFEYLPTGRPILCIPDDKDTLKEFIDTTKAGKVCDSIDETADFIKKHYDQWKKTGKVKKMIPLQTIQKYSRLYQTKKLAEILDRCTAYSSRS